MQRKKRIIRISVILAAFLLVCTLLSQTIYHLMLPQVKAVSPTNGTLFEKQEYTGQIGYVNTEDITAQVPWDVLTLRVSKGMTVKAGDVIMTVDTTDADIEREQLVLNLASAERQVSSAYGTARRQAEIDRKRAERALEKHDLLYPKDGVVTAKQDGRVVAIDCKAGTTNTGTLVRIETADSSAEVSWEMEEKAGRLLDVGTVVGCLITDGSEAAYSGSAAIKTLEENAFGGYTASVHVSAEAPLSSNASSLVTVEIQSEPYATIVPRSAVKNLLTGDIVYVVSNESGIFGQNYVCRPVSVQVLEQNTLYAAVDIKLDKEELVVVYASKALSDNSEVLLVS